MPASPSPSPSPSRSSPVRRAPSLLPDQVPDAVEILLLIAGLVAPMEYPQFAAAVDDHGAGHPGDLVQLTHLAFLIVEDRKAHRGDLQPLIRRIGVRLHVHPDEREAEFLVPLVDAREQAHLLAPV